MRFDGDSMISKTAAHTITALAALARLPEGEYAGAFDIAMQIGAPPNYLGKLLKTLADSGLLESQKGKGGGFRLARDPADISLFQVIEPIDPVSRWLRCFLGGSQCSDEYACPVHHRWSVVRDAYLQFLEEISIADLTAQAGFPLSR